MLCFSMPPPLYSRRRLQIFEIRPIEIREISAHSANQVVVNLEVWIEACFVNNLDSSDESVAFERSKGPINSIKGDGREAIPYPPVNVLGRWMIVGFHYFKKDLESLRGKLDSSIFADSSKSIKFVFQQFTLFLVFHLGSLLGEEVFFITNRLLRNAMLSRQRATMGPVGANPRRQTQPNPRYVRLIGACPRRGTDCRGKRVTRFEPCMGFRYRLLGNHT